MLAGLGELELDRSSPVADLRCEREVGETFFKSSGDRSVLRRRPCRVQDFEVNGNAGGQQTDAAKTDKFVEAELRTEFAASVALGATTTPNSVNPCTRTRTATLVPMVDLDDVRAQLRTAADGLADAAMDTLRAAMRSRDQEEITELRAKEKRLTRARRSVEKAVSLLDGRD